MYLLCFMFADTAFLLCGAELQIMYKNTTLSMFKGYFYVFCIYVFSVLAKYYIQTWSVLDYTERIVKMYEKQ